MYSERFYRAWVSGGELTRFRVVLFESDLEIAADYDLSGRACAELTRLRDQLKRYIALRREFLTSMTPVEIEGDHPAVIEKMLGAARRWQVGPMAAVAGAVAEEVACSLSKHTGSVIVENGGDIFALAPGRIEFGLFAGGRSPFSGVLGFSAEAGDGIGVCTSSGTLGHSTSFGNADAVTVISDSGSLSDAAATALANRIHSPSDLQEQVSRAYKMDSVQGVIACCGGQLAAAGVELFRTDGREEA